jgi:hypothetical protein
MPDCPKWLLPEAKMEWERLCVKLSEMGVLTDFAFHLLFFATYIKCQDRTFDILYDCIIKGKGGQGMKVSVDISGSSGVIVG